MTVLTTTEVFMYSVHFHVSNHIVKLQVDDNIPPIAVQRRKILEYLFTKRLRYQDIVNTFLILIKYIFQIKCQYQIFVSFVSL